MKPRKTAARVAALLAAVLAVAELGSTVHGQPRAVRAPRALDMLAGRGSEIGVSVRDVDGDSAKGSNAGVLIADVTADSPAEKAGIRKGDVIAEFDGARVRSVRQFTRLVQETPAGRRVSAALTRDGQRTAVTVEPRESSAIRLLGDLDGVLAMGGFDRDFLEGFPVPPVPPPPPAPSAPSAPAQPGMPPPPPSAPIPDIQSFFYRSGTGLGMTISSLSDQLADYFGAKRGVLVTAVQDGSAAQKAGFKAGDVVTALNGTDVSQPAELSRATQRLRDGDDFTADVVREKKSLTLKGKVERRTSRSATRVSI